MKIATLTFHASHNYGSVLQAYALSKKLELMGHNVEIINLRSQEQKRAYEIIPEGPFNTQKAFKYAIYPKLKRRFDEYERFINCVLPITKREYSSTDALKYDNPKYDAFICGGDQIWNPACQDFQTAYYLQFLPENDSSIRISYAPSFGRAEFDDSDMENFGKWIKVFDHISVREQSGAEILKKVTDKPVKVVCDPVLLLEREQWEKLAVKPKYTKPYILTYFLSNNHGDRSLLSWIKEKTGYEVVMLNEFIRDYVKPYHKAIDASPEEFVGLFLNASFVYTNSFHGTAFATLFNKPFFTAVAADKNAENNNDSRKIDFLKKMGLENRIVTGIPEKEDTKMDFSAANKKLKEFRKESLEYLEKALKTEKK